MRVAVIGGGSAGLAAAWLLQDDHDVTLIEKQPRLGGHAHTVAVEHKGGTVQVESGCEFFTEDSHPAFFRLLHELQIPLRHYPVTFTLYLEEAGTVHLMPPKRHDGIFWPAFAPRSLTHLLQFEFFLRRGARLVDQRNTSVTVGDFVASLPISPRFCQEFLYPFVLGGWCIPLDEFRRMAAYNVLKYLVLNRPPGLEPRAFAEVPGGLAAYVAALRSSLPRVKVRSGIEIRCIRRAGDGFVVMNAAGDAWEFDHLVFATNASDAGQLLSCVDGTEEERAVLSRFQYFATWIAVHGDRRLMPPDEKHWSVFNIRWRNERTLSTVWRQQRESILVFKSWVDPDAPAPAPLYHLTRYEHPLVTVDYFQAQQRLAQLQGRRNLWFAGVYTHDIDSHESAIQSAIHVTRQLAPSSRNLARLL